LGQKLELKKKKKKKKPTSARVDIGDADIYINMEQVGTKERKGFADKNQHRGHSPMFQVAECA
jgi:hypothetical protein